MSGPGRAFIGHGGILAHAYLRCPLFGHVSRLGSREGYAGELTDVQRELRKPLYALASAAALRRCLATRSRLPHTSLEHQRRLRPRDMSR